MGEIFKRLVWCALGANTIFVIVSVYLVIFRLLVQHGCNSDEAAMASIYACALEVLLIFLAGGVSDHF